MLCRPQVYYPTLSLNPWGQPRQGGKWEVCTLQQDAHGRGMGMLTVVGREWWGCWDVGGAGMGMFMVGWGYSQYCDIGHAGVQCW